MKAQVRCSNCGAEITNLNFSWARKQWIWFLPFMLFVILSPVIMTNAFLKENKHNFRTELSVKDLEKRYTNGTIEILGVIENHGSVNWENIVVKAELYGKDGKFLDLVTGRVSSNLLPGTSDRFKVSAKNIPRDRWDSITDMKVRVSDAYHSRF